MSDYDAVVVGAGIAGLGVATQLQQSGKKTLLLEMYPRTGGRMQSYELSGGYKVDIGLHLIEMGSKGYCHELGTRVGKEFEWAAFSVTLDLYADGSWHDMQEYIKLTEEEKAHFIGIMKNIATMEEDPTQAYNQDDATGFIRLNALRLKVSSGVHGKRRRKRAARSKPRRR